MKKAHTDLGGGMIGAVLFALFYFLFDTAGTKLAGRCLNFDWIYSTDWKNFRPSIRVKFLWQLEILSKNNGRAFIEDMQNWLHDWKENREAKKVQREEDKEQASIGKTSGKPYYSCCQST